MSLEGKATATQKVRGKIMSLEAIHGASAYELAVRNGYKGTEEEWLESLHGRDGAHALDETLTKEGYAADAKAVGDVVKALELGYEQDAVLPVSKGGTGATTADAARANLGAAATVHGHAISDVSGLQPELDGKSENGVEETDSSSAYVKSVPATAANYAKVNKIGGMTRKCTNLLPYPYDDTTHTVNGITFVDNGDGTITANGTATGNATYFMKNHSLSLSAGKYTISGLPFDGSWTTAITQLASSNGFAFNNFLAQGETFTLDSEVNDMVVVLVVFKGYTANNLVFKPMFNEGSTALPYEPYFDGLRSAPVTEVESVGANLFGGETLADKLVSVSGATKDEKNKIVTYAASNVNGKVLFENFKQNTRYTFIFKGYNSSATQAVNVNIKYTDGTAGPTALFGLAGIENCWYYVSAEGKSIQSFYGTWNTQSTTLYYEECGIFEGVLTVEDFKPYTRNTLPIPEAVRPKHGINESVYDYIDLDKKQFVKMVGKVVFDGSADENWVVRQYTNLVAFLESEKFGKIPNRVLCDRFDSFIDMSAQSNGTVGIAVEGLSTAAHTFFFGVSGIATNVTEWRAYLAANPITVYYELATPVVTDISDLLSADNILSVEAGGTVTMRNEYGYDVPSDITFYTNANDSYLGAKGFVGDLLGTAARAECDPDGNSIPATYAKSSGKAMVFIAPSEEEFLRIMNHVNATDPIPDEEIPLYDFTNNGIIEIDDAMLVLQEMHGNGWSFKDWSGAQAVEATFTFDPSDMEAPIKFTGTNMWGNPFTRSFRWDDLGISVTEGGNLYRLQGSEKEWLNPPMTTGIEFRTTERYNGQAVYKKVDATTGNVLWRVEGETTWRGENASTLSVGHCSPAFFIHDDMGHPEIVHTGSVRLREGSYKVCVHCNAYMDDVDCTLQDGAAILCIPALAGKTINSGTIRICGTMTGGELYTETVDMAGKSFDETGTITMLECFTNYGSRFTYLNGTIVIA